MRQFIFPYLFLLLGIKQAGAFALFGRQQPTNNGTSPGFNKRVQQQAIFATQFSTLFISGDASKTRTANFGFDCRVDVLNGLWGFCPATVIAATDCGLAGSCVDSFSCSKGCGFTDTPLTTFTCSGSDEPYCSTALLTLSNNVGPFTYLACGKGRNTDQYMAFTTTASPTPPKSTSTSSPGSTTSSGPQSTSTAGSTNSQAASQSTSRSTSTSDSASPSGNPPTTGTPTANANANTIPTPSADSDPASGSGINNTGAIIGGIVGCVALLCIFGLAALWLMRRNRAAAAAAAKASSSTISLHPTDPPPAFDAKPELPSYSYAPAELSGRAPAPAAYDRNVRFGGGYGYPPMTPVEMPATPGTTWK